MSAPNHSENAVLTATDSITTGMLSELSTSLDELYPLASRIADLKKETMEREAAALKTILEKITPLVSLLSKDCEQHYRREIIILTREERVQLEEGLHLGWENTDEDVLTPEAAIITFGFTAILKGLIKALGEASSMVILKEKLEGDLAALTEALDALQ